MFLLFSFSFHEIIREELARATNRREGYCDCFLPSYEREFVCSWEDWLEKKKRTRNFRAILFFSRGRESLFVVDGASNQVSARWAMRIIAIVKWKRNKRVKTDICF